MPTGKPTEQIPEQSTEVASSEENGLRPQALLEDPAYANRFLDLHQGGDAFVPDQSRLGESDARPAVAPQPQRVVIRNLTIEQLTPDRLHGNWDWLKRGAIDILKKIAPHSDWLPEDLYAALRFPEASHTVCWLVTRNQRSLGWACGEIQKDRYGKLEFFLWDAWTIPLAERLPQDDVDGARDQLIDYIKLWAKANGCWRLTTLSARKLEALGWVKGHTVYYLPV